MTDTNISPVDHFPAVLKHFSDERLLKFAALLGPMVSIDPGDGFLQGRVAACEKEIARRSLLPRIRIS